MPLLKEFDLIADMEHVKNIDFSRQTRCITSLYERFFPQFKTEDCWKVLINCVPMNPKSSYRNMLGVYVLDVIGNVGEFFTLADIDKKLWTYNQLQLGITELIKQTKWEKDPFKRAFEQVLKIDLRNEWVWRKKYSPSRKIMAEVWINHGIYSCAISLKIRNKDGQIIREQELVSELPSEWAYVGHLGSLKWASEARVSLINKSHTQEWSIDL